MTPTTSEQVINLSPGEVYFGYAPKIIKTLLGSCVAITIWHEKLKIGGMCHYLMAKHSHKNEENLYKYGTHALNYLFQQMSAFSAAQEYQVCLFGGSNMYIINTQPTIGEQNVNFAKKWIKNNNLNLINEDTLGQMSRKITLDLSTGSIQTIHNEV